MTKLTVAYHIRVILKMVTSHWMIGDSLIQLPGGVNLIINCKQVYQIKCERSKAVRKTNTEECMGA